MRIPSYIFQTKKSFQNDTDFSLILDKIISDEHNCSAVSYFISLLAISLQSYLTFFHDPFLGPILLEQVQVLEYQGNYLISVIWKAMRSIVHTYRKFRKQHKTFLFGFWFDLEIFFYSKVKKLKKHKQYLFYQHFNNLDIG